MVTSIRLGLSARTGARPCPGNAPPLPGNIPPPALGFFMPGGVVPPGGLLPPGPGPPAAG